MEHRWRMLLEYWLDPGDATIPSWRSLRTAKFQFGWIVSRLDLDAACAGTTGSTACP